MRDLLSELEEKNRVLEERLEEQAAQLEAMKQTLSRETEERKKSDEALRGILNHAPAIVYMKDLDSRYIFINKRCESVLGIKCGEIVGKTPQEVFSKDLADQFVRNDRKVIESLRPCEIEETIPQPDGVHTVVSLQFPLFDALGKPYGICGISADITERKRVEQALRESEERFEAFMDHSPAIAWMKDEEGRYVYFSVPCQNHFGIKPEEWLGKTDFDYWPEDVARGFRENDLAVLRSGKVMEVIEKNYSPDHTPVYYWNFKFPFEDASGKRYVGGVGIDITEHERLAEELRLSEELFRKAFDHAPMGIAILDLQGRFKHVNEAYCRITGFSEGELLQTDFMRLTHPEDLEYNLQQLERSLTGEIPAYSVEKRFLHKNDTFLWVRVSATVRRDAAGRPFQIIGILEDITDRVQLTQELRKSHEELESKVQERTSQLQEKSETLEELNTALKILLNQRDADKKEFEESVLTNIRNLVLPYVEKLKESQLASTQTAWVQILETHLSYIVSSFSKTLGVGAESLTPIEMRVAALVRDGKTSAEIAQALCISEKTVTFHRFNIRKKLGLRGEKKNLRTHLSRLA